MKLGPVAPAALPADPLRAPTVGVQAARWRQALEQAQWQRTGSETQRGAAAKPAAAPGSASEHSARALLRPASTGTESMLDGAPHGNHRGSSRAAGTNDGAAGDPLGSAASEPGADAAPAGDKVVRAVVTGAIATTLAAAPGAPAGAWAHASAEAPTGKPAAPPLAEPVTVRWPPFSAQAHVEGGAVHAAVRDPRLAADDADELERRLAAQLAADGLELVELRVNGRVAGSSAQRTPSR